MGTVIFKRSFLFFIAPAVALMASVLLRSVYRSAYKASYTIKHIDDGWGYRI